jgi:hypothetical protein
MDTKTLVVGQDVFMRSGGFGDWATVAKVIPTGVVVQSDPAYGDELIRFDENGTACDSSDIGVGEYKDIVLFDYDKTGYIAPHRVTLMLTLKGSRPLYPTTTRRDLLPAQHVATDVSSGSVFGRALNA